MNTRKLKIPKIDKALAEIKADVEASKQWLQEAVIYDEEEYAAKAQYVKLWDIILNQLEEWQRNFFIWDYTNEDIVENKAKAINLNPNSYRVYQSNIRKQIRDLCK